MRVVAYCRVSGASQVDGYGIPNQGDAISTFCRGAGLEIVSTHVDVVSGTAPMHDREALTTALRVIRDMDAEGIVVARMDRLARKLTVQEAILSQVWKYRGTVFTADMGEVRQDDPSDPMLTAFRQVLGIFAELDRAMTVNRLDKGRLAKKAAGGYVGGKVPYGFRRTERGNLTEDPAEQEVLSETAWLVLHDGMSLRQAAQVLDSKGMRNRSDKPFDPKSLSRMLTTAQAVANLAS